MFFADPYVSNQKGSVENMNGQLRLHFPKGGSVDGLSEERVREANEAMIDKPLKSLGARRLFGLPPGRHSKAKCRFWATLSRVKSEKMCSAASNGLNNWNWRTSFIYWG